MDCVFKLVGQPLFTAWCIELREVESDEVCPVDCVKLVSSCSNSRIAAHTHALSLTLLVADIQVACARLHWVRFVLGWPLRFVGGGEVFSFQSRLEERGGATNSEANSKDIDLEVPYLADSSSSSGRPYWWQAR